MLAILMLVQIVPFGDNLPEDVGVPFF